MEEFRGISVGEVSLCSLVNAWLCASDEEGKEEEEETVVERRRQSREQVRKSKVRGFGPRLERFGGVISLHIIVACVLCSRGGIDFTFRGIRGSGELVINNGGKF